MTMAERASATAATDLLLSSSSRGENHPKGVRKMETQGGQGAAVASDAGGYGYGSVCTHTAGDVAPVEGGGERGSSGYDQGSGETTPLKTYRGENDKDCDESESSQVASSSLPSDGLSSSTLYVSADDLNKDSASSPPDAPPPQLHPLRILSILSTASAYGSIMTTLFLLTLPLECERIEELSGGTVSKSVALGGFAAAAGAAQLVCPLVGTLSDRYRSQSMGASKTGEGSGWLSFTALHSLHVRGRRLPYLLLGSLLTLLGLWGQQCSSSSYSASHPSYILSFVLSMVGINVVYCVMIALIPDLVPDAQTGLANGTLALLLVGGSLFGFAMFHTVLEESVDEMYAFYWWVMMGTAMLTLLTANGLTEDAEAPADAERGTDKEDGKAEPGSSPLGLLHRMFIRPLDGLPLSSLLRLYYVDPSLHHDFFVVTLSRTFYYAGLSSQAFFLYYVHDVVHLHSDPEAAVAMLAVVGQCAGAITCYPVGLISDHLCGGRRRPFVYGACVILALGNLALLECGSIEQVVWVCAMLGAANGVYLTMDTSLAVDTLPPPSSSSSASLSEGASADVEKGNVQVDYNKGARSSEEEEDGSAQLLGVWGVAGFVGSALGPLLGGPLLYIFGRVPDHIVTDLTLSEVTAMADNGGGAQDNGDAEYGWFGYCFLFSASALSFLMSALVLRWVKARDV